MMPTVFRLAEWLDRKGMTQSELSRRSGISLVTINRMCANHTEGVTLRTLDSLDTALGCKPGELIEQTRPRGGSKGGR